MTVLLTPCHGCGSPIPMGRGGRCADCRRPMERAHHNRAYDRPEYRRAQGQAIAAWVARNGYVCPGDAQHARHAVEPRDLTCDHPVPLARGGALVQRFVITCRSANSRKGAR